MAAMLFGWQVRSDVCPFYLVFWVAFCNLSVAKMAEKGFKK